MAGEAKSPVEEALEQGRAQVELLREIRDLLARIEERTPAD